MMNEEEPALAMSIAEVAISLSVSEASVRNWIKTGYLESPYRGYISSESFDRFKEGVAGNDKLTRRANKLHCDSHDHSELCTRIANSINQHSSKHLGELVAKDYENSLSQSYKNKEGVFYTPSDIAESFFADIAVDFEKATFCDPCCGTGNFLVAALKAGFKASNIYGFDIDETALQIAKLRLGELAGQSVAHIEHRDFLASESLDSDHERFDVIVTNPPWGKKLDKDTRITLAKRFQAQPSADSSALFYFACHRATKPSGFIGLLLPESFFNIAKFADARHHLLLDSIIKLCDFGNAFKGLVTKAQGFVSQKQRHNIGHSVMCEFDGKSYERPQSTFSDNPGKIINLTCTEEEHAVIIRMFSLPHVTLLNQAKWGLGIVTGNNSKFCQAEPKEGYMPVYKGSDIKVGELEAPTCFIPADLGLYQQVAPESLYRAQEKLLYRFISSSLVFYCDLNQSFCLNSANMIVLNKEFPVQSNAVASLLNSKTMNWLFKKLFNTHKILRSDLEALPIFHEFVKEYGERFEDRDLQAYLGIEEFDGTLRIKK